MAKYDPSHTWNLIRLTEMIRQRWRGRDVQERNDFVLLDATRATPDPSIDCEKITQPMPKLFD